jgi:succinate dehydrogenase/fumarate reductase flavoprotein subunit
MSQKPKDGTLGRRDFLKRSAAVGAGTTALAGLDSQNTAAQAPRWDRVADVVVVGSGAAGLPAAIRARERNATVIVVDENVDVGGHGMISGGAIHIGGGTSLQKKFGIEDSADQVYLDNTRPDHPMMRYNDRNIVRAFADHNVEVFDFLVKSGVKFAEVKPSNLLAQGVHVARQHPVLRWSDDIKETINGSGGSGVMRPLEARARASGVEILLQHRMIRFVRERPAAGRMIGVTTTNLKNNSTVNIRARKAVISCTGGSSNNLVVRTIYDTRLTEEYQVGCSPYSKQSGDTEQQGMAVGASLGSTSNQRNEALVAVQKTAFIGCRYGYEKWRPDSPCFAAAGATGIGVRDYQDVILVNVLGDRFYDETVPNNLNDPQGNRAVFDYFAAAMSSAIVEIDGTKRRVGGPIWAVFDADAVKREEWDPRPPFVDVANGYFFTADTLAQLAEQLRKNAYQKFPMKPAALQETVARYNSYVDMGKDPDFHKPTPRYKIQTPPFYAAWATPILHDTYAGLRVNEKYQVVDIFGRVIPGFYCAGESASGITLHGLGKCIVGGYIAGTNAVLEPQPIS